MYADAAVFASNRLKPAKTRLMTVEINSDGHMRAQASPNMMAPARMNSIQGPLPGAPLTSPPPMMNVAAGLVQMSTVLSGPVANNVMLNAKADEKKSLFHICADLRSRLKQVRGFEERYLTPQSSQNEDDGAFNVEDPVTQLWRIFRMGISLCFLYNATLPARPVEEERPQDANLSLTNIAKAAVFRFITACKTELGLDGDNSFMIMNLFGDDTNGFVKVTKVVEHLLNIIEEKGLLLKRISDGSMSDENELLSSIPQGSREGLPMPLVQALNEFVDTERKYVQDLEAMQDFMRAIILAEALSQDDVHGLFLNLNSLLDFQRKFLIGVETQNSLPWDQQRWGVLFIKNEMNFSVYETFLANFKDAQEICMARQADLLKVKHGINTQLAAFLIKPAQRICKYPLLLNQFLEHCNPEDPRTDELKEGIAAILRANERVNEYIGKLDMAKEVEDLEWRVEDWKGHRLEQFGELLLSGIFNVIKTDAKGDLEREYQIYLFERILLCCKEAGKDKSNKANKTQSMSRKTGKVKSKLQLKGRIFMQNVTDICSFSKNGQYTLQIFWKGEPGVENFLIKHKNEESLRKWTNALQKQYSVWSFSGAANRSSGENRGGTSNTEFFALSTGAVDMSSYRTQSDDENSDDDDNTGSGAYSQRSISSMGVRSRSATGDSTTLRLPPMQAPPRFPLPPNGTNLSLMTAISPMSEGVPGALPAGNSYFSPVNTESPMSFRTSSSSNSSYFPRAGGSQYGQQHDSYSPAMGRSASRDGTTPGSMHSARVQQRPSLPGMTAPISGLPPNVLSMQASRSRSASSPDIQRLPLGARPNMPPVPMPAIPAGMPTGTIPAQHVALLNRSMTSSPSIPLPAPPTRSSTTSPAIAAKGPPQQNQQVTQVKIKAQYNEDKFVLVVPVDIEYKALLNRIERKVRMCTNPANGASGDVETPLRLRIKYMDEDGDYIVVNSSEDVEMAFETRFNTNGDSVCLFVTQVN